MRYQALGISKAGAVKDTNQDSFLIEIADTFAEDLALVAVADGMGGLAKGELASATVIRKLSDWFESKVPPSLEVLESSVEGFQQFVEGQWHGFVQDANLDIMRYGLKIKAGLGSTLTAMLAMGARYSIMHVGDSRVYEITDESIKQLTEDQTYVRREYKAGRLSKEEAKNHPQSNVLLQCIGFSKEVKPEIIHGNINKNATYLLCSDGFRRVLEEEEIQQAFAPSKLLWNNTKSSSYPEAVLEATIKKVIDRHEADNITAVLLRVREGDK